MASERSRLGEAADAVLAATGYGAVQAANEGASAPEESPGPGLKASTSAQSFLSVDLTSGESAGDLVERDGAAPLRSAQAPAHDRDSDGAGAAVGRDARPRRAGAARAASGSTWEGRSGTAKRESFVVAQRISVRVDADAAVAEDDALMYQAALMVLNAYAGIAMSIVLLEDAFDASTGDYDSGWQGLRWALSASTLLLLLQLGGYYLYAAGPWRTDFDSRAAAREGWLPALLVEAVVLSIHPPPDALHFGSAADSDEAIGLFMLLRAYLLVRLHTHCSAVYRNRRLVVAAARRKLARREHVAAVVAGRHSSSATAPRAPRGRGSATDSDSKVATVATNGDDDDERDGDGRGVDLASRGDDALDSAARVAALRDDEVWRRLSDAPSALRLPRFGAAMALRARFEQSPWLFLAAVFALLFSHQAWAVYISERGLQPDDFTFAASCWFVIETQTTVGYGELVPMNWSGRLVASVCVVTGVMTLAACTVVLLSQAECSPAEGAATRLLASIQRQLRGEDAAGGGGAAAGGRPRPRSRARSRSRSKSGDVDVDGDGDSRYSMSLLSDGWDDDDDGTASAAHLGTRTQLLYRIIKQLNEIEAQQGGLLRRMAAGAT